ncbi:hypothetical protein [Aquimarina spinulae]|uniref:hypothetical protein n=1 Tax=Aquimarina spinulae TaxID=1192023 RepID=UPI001045918F|nr:hypothetical protein [Aquimarina spinulae]
MERNREKMKKRYTSRMSKDNINTFRKFSTQGDDFLNKPIVKTVAKTILISGGIFGVLYISKYFFSVTAKMIKSFKEMRNACKE